MLNILATTLHTGTWIPVRFALITHISCPGDTKKILERLACGSKEKDLDGSGLPATSGLVKSSLQST